VKVMTIVGTRPEIIRLSRVIARLDDTAEHILVHTGQNYDYSLSQVFFDELSLRPPDHHLKVDTSSLGHVLGDTLIRSEEVLKQERPDAVLVLGDTNSCIASVMAKRMHIPVYHMEAGNRCFDANVPEETNRRLVDHVADFNLVYTEHARRNLLAEGLHPRRILLTGSPMREVLNHYLPRIDASDVLPRLHLEPLGYVIASSHREETVDDPGRLTSLLASLRAVRDHWRVRVIVSTHPRTRQRLQSLASNDLDRILFHEPFGFLDFARLQMNALCTLSDSGTVSEESAMLGFPAVTLRDSIERPESLDAGSIVMSGIEPAGVLEAMTAVVGDGADRTISSVAPEYTIADCSRRVVRFIVSTAKRHAQWAGLRAPRP
jgi:UDP-N-acetylglucosamine 2-epimerase